MDELLRQAMVKLTQVITYIDKYEDEGYSRNLDPIVTKIRSHATSIGCIVRSDFSDAEISKMLLQTYDQYFLTDLSLDYNMAVQKSLADAYKLERLIQQEAQDYADKILLFCKVFEIQIQNHEMKRLICSLELLSLLGLLHTNFKFLSNYYFCKMDSFQTPAPEQPGFFVKSMIPRSLSYALSRACLQSSNGSGKIRSDTIIYTFFQGLKKSFVPIRPEHIDQSLLKHCKALCTPPAPLSEGFTKFAKRALDREYKSLLVPKNLLYKKPRCGTMSNKSTVETSRARGGQVGYGSEVLGSSPLLPRIRYFQGYAVINTKVQKGSEVYLSKDEIVEYYSFHSDDDLIEAIMSEKMSGACRSHVVQPAVVLEPMKGRIITKPCSGDYLSYTNIQKYLWTNLQKMRSFELIGRTVDTLDVHWVLKSISNFGFMVSGDYSGATDNISSDLSSLIINFLFSNYSDDERAWILDSFCSTRVDYTRLPLQTKEGEFSELIVGYESQMLGTQRQRNGQLMGHVLSFIVLCIANKLAFDYTCKLRKVSRPNVLINGDDILFYSPDREFYEEWMRVVRSVGFSPSPGKNLTSNNLCQINSVLFRLHYYDPLDLTNSNVFRLVREVKVVPYLNFGIVVGRGKGKDDPISRVDITEEETPIELVQSLHDQIAMISGRWGGKWSYTNAVAAFFEYHAPKLEKLRNLIGFQGDYLSKPESFWKAAFPKNSRLGTPLNSMDIYLKSIDQSMGEIRNSFRKELTKYQADPFYVLKKEFPFEAFEEQEYSRSYDRL